MKKLLLFAIAAFGLCANAQEAQISIEELSEMFPGFASRQVQAERSEAPGINGVEMALKSPSRLYKKGCNYLVHNYYGGEETSCHYYTFDNEGKEIGDNYFIKNVFSYPWMLKNSSEYEYDELGRVVKNVYYTDISKTTGTISTTEYYDWGYEYKSVDFGSKYPYGYRSVSEYGENGMIAKSTQYDLYDGNWVASSITTNTYNADDLIAESLTDYLDRGYLKKVEYKYDGIDKPSQILEYNSEDKENWILLRINQYEYDSNGNSVYEIYNFYDGEETPSAINIFEYTYTEDGQVLESLFTFKTSLSETKSRIVYEYDSEGIILKISQFDQSSEDANAWVLTSYNSYDWNDPVMPTSSHLDYIYLVGQPSGWMEPSQANAEAYEPWKLKRIKGNYSFYGEFEIPEGQAMFRIYSQLNGWEQDSWGTQVYDSPIDFNFESYFSFGMVSGKGSFNFPDWTGGKMYILVTPEEHVASIEILSSPLDVEIDGNFDAVVSQVEYTPEYYTLQGIKVANPKAGNIYICRKGNKTSKIIF